MRISLIIPYLEVDEGKKEILERCLHSVEGMYDELIVVDDTDISLAKKINKGFKQAHGDFLVLSNDDIIMREGTLRDLCMPGEVHVPVVHGGIDKTYHGHMACIPRGVYEQIGGYDEDYPAYYQDSDYWVRLIKAEIPVVKNERVHIDHPEPGRTLGKLSENMEEGRRLFIEKHGKNWLSLVE